MAEQDAEPAGGEPTLGQRVAAGGLVGAMTAGVAGAPPLAVLASGAGGAILPYAEIAFRRVFGEFSADARARVNEMLAVTDHELGDGGPATLSDLTARSEQTRLMTAMAGNAVASTAWPPKVVAIGKVLAAGLIGDDEATIDEALLALSAMADMERSHVSLLELLVEYRPQFTVAASEAVPYERWATADGTWHAGGREWTAYQITAIRPQLRPVLAGLIGTLVRHGLAVENNDTAEALRDALQGFERSGRQQARQIRAGSRLTASALQPHIPGVPRIVQNWSPTELGEQVLGFYRQAADETAGHNS